MEDKAREFGAELRRLHEAEQRGMPLREWYVDAIALSRRVMAEAAVCNLVAHFIWHWLSDADVRKKPPEMAAIENARILEVIGQLDQGVWPD